MFNKKIRNSIVSILLLSLIVTGCSSAASANSENVSASQKGAGEAKELTVADSGDSENADTDKAEGDGFDVGFRLTGDPWEGGFQTEVELKATGNKDMNNWVLEFDFDAKIGDMWNAKIKENSGKHYVISCDNDTAWNKDIKVGKSVKFGFIGKSNFKGFPKDYKLTGDIVESNSTPDPNVTPEPDATDDPNGSATPEPSVKPDATTDPDENLEDAKVTKGDQVKKHGRLKIKGRYIVDKSGKRYLIKGTSTHGIAWFPEYVNKSAFNSLKKWGANTVRLACYTSPGEQYSPSKDWKTIDKGVKAASDLGMYCIIDWHILNDNNPKTTLKRAKKFFKHFAKKYKNKKNIIWEICNEPHWCSWKSDIKPYAKKIYKVIRKYSKNIIVVGTNTWSQDVDEAANSPLSKKTYKNVCYTLHFYAATHKDDLRKKVKYAVKKKLPILCTEYSICNESGSGSKDTSSAKKWIKLLKKNKIGFINWSLCNKAETASMLKTSCKKTGKFKKSNLTSVGKWIIKQWK
ncbi:MAG: cellulase family glycosylhydrolase [Eubacterium sp.]|nr:cellulase family glycosylhydrolase [Eubacterium sp.]